MATDQQRIHPAAVPDVETPPTTTIKKMKALGYPHPRPRPPPPPPPVSRPVPFPLPVPRPPRKGNLCCKIVCWTLSSIIALLVILGVTIGILYLVFQPKVPNYVVDSLRITDLRLNFNLTLYAQFDVKITADNPNKKIGIYYEKKGRISVWYKTTKLCEGSLPKFYQGHQNITKLELVLTGQNQYGSSLMSALQEEQQTGRIPLDLRVEAPVAIKLGRLKTRKVKILGDCMLLVDTLTANTLVSIKASNCKFRIKL